MSSAKSPRQGGIFNMLDPVFKGETTPISYKRMITLGLLGFVLVAGAVQLGVDSPLDLYAPMRSEKLRLMHDSRDQASAVAFGSSHVHNGFDPRAFDRQMSGGSLPTRTVNLAVEGGSQVEQSAMAAKFLDLVSAEPKPANCRLVLLELNAGVNFTTANLTSPRAINIYDLDSLTLVSKFSGGDAPAFQRIGRMAYASAAFGLHFLNLGMLSNAIFKPQMSSDEFRAETENDRRGLLVAPFNEKQYRAVGSILDGRPPHPAVGTGSASRGHRFLIDRLIAEYPGEKLRFAYFVTPSVNDVKARVVYPRCIETAAGKTPILNVADPALHPELYRQELWRDSTHLNEDGASTFSALLGAQARAWYDHDQFSATCASS